MTQKQKAYRVKVLWIKARLVFHFIRMKQSANSDTNKKSEADGGMDFENINFSQDNAWKWYIIR